MATSISSDAVSHLRNPLPKTQGVPVSLKPKEHGAYAILAIPIATSLVISGFTVVGTAVVIASLAGFFAHEPLLVALGHRGPRAVRDTPAAQRQAIVLTAVMIVAGMIAFFGGGTNVRWSLVACAVLMMTSFSLAFAGKHRSLAGQLWGVVGLSVPSVAVLLAGKIDLNTTMMIWATWLMGFAGTTMAVRGVIAAQKRSPRSIHYAVITLLSVIVASTVLLPNSFPKAVLPMLLMSWCLMIWPPPAKHLKRVGWSLVAATVGSAVWIIGLAIRF